jgi:hypothetical protein
MPLHGWSNEAYWSGFHIVWLVELLRNIKPQLPEGYRVYIGSYSRSGLATAIWPDIEVAVPIHIVPASETDEPSATTDMPPDEEVLIETIEPQKALYVQYRGMMVAAVEIVSPRNKDRVSARAEATARYAGYLHGRIHLMLLDLLPRPEGFSFPDAIAAELKIPNQPHLAPPCAVVYRVGEPAAAGGSQLAVWRRPLTVDQPLPTLPLPLSVDRQVLVDLEATYMRAAADAYLT